MLTVKEQLAFQHREIERLKQWVSDCQSGMYVNCVYCGHCYGPGETTPVSMADALKAHIEQCPDHPMSHLKAKLVCIRKALEEIVCVVPPDDGVILLSQDGPTHIEVIEGREVTVYNHEHFSPLGDALMEVWKMTEP